MSISGVSQESQHDYHSIQTQPQRKKVLLKRAEFFKNLFKQCFSCCFRSKPAPLTKERVNPDPVSVVTPSVRAAIETPAPNAIKSVQNQRKTHSVPVSVVTPPPVRAATVKAPAPDATKSVQTEGNIHPVPVAVEALQPPAAAAKAPTSDATKSFQKPRKSEETQKTTTEQAELIQKRKAIQALDNDLKTSIKQLNCQRAEDVRSTTGYEATIQTMYQRYSELFKQIHNNPDDLKTQLSSIESKRQEHLNIMVENRFAKQRLSAYNQTLQSIENQYKSALKENEAKPVILTNVEELGKCHEEMLELFGKLSQASQEAAAIHYPNGLAGMHSDRFYLSSKALSGDTWP